MIIQIRGTSGSGKTTAMRKIMATLGPWEKCYIPRRKGPLYYLSKDGRVAVLGNYDNEFCGGCDNVAKEVVKGFLGADGVEAVYCLTQVVEADVIICEGLLLSEETRWTMEMSKSAEVRLLFLTTPIDQCIKQVGMRRAAKGNERDLNEKLKTTSKYSAAKRIEMRAKTIERARLKLEGMGLTCRRATSDQASKIVLGWVANSQSTSLAASS